VRNVYITFTPQNKRNVAEFFRSFTFKGFFGDYFLTLEKKYNTINYKQYIKVIYVVSIVLFLEWIFLCILLHSWLQMINYVYFVYYVYICISQYDN